MAESGLSENVFYAAVAGDIDHIKNWLEQGGDPNQGLAQAYGPETPEAAKRLFGGVPDPCFWLVVEYAWLRNWRRP